MTHDFQKKNTYMTHDDVHAGVLSLTDVFKKLVTEPEKKEECTIL